MLVCVCECLVSAGARPRPNDSKRRPSGELSAANVFYVFVNLLLHPQMSSRCMLTPRTRIPAIVEPLAADGHQSHVHIATLLMRCTISILS